LFQDEHEVGRKEKDCLPIIFKIMWLEGKTIYSLFPKGGGGLRTNKNHPCMPKEKEVKG
jgi:hypothetical protein